jgi:hypothetical protein
VHFFIISTLSFRVENNWISGIRAGLILIVFKCMSPTRSEYSKLGLELVSLEENHSHTPKKPSMVEENKNDKEDDSINMLLEQALTRQRDKMMENFSHILQRLSIASGASSSSNHFGGTSPFKVQVNFDIPIFEGQIDADALEKWLNLLEGYFFFTIFPIEKRSFSHSLRLSPMSNIGGKLTGRKIPQRSLEYMGSRSHLGFFCGCGKGTILPCWQL